MQRWQWHVRLIDNGSGALHSVPLKNVTIIAEDDDSDVALLKVEGHAAESAGKHNHLTGLNLLKAVHARNTIPNGDHLSHF